jgi:Family of unknown function (DUF6941)
MVAEILTACKAAQDSDEGFTIAKAFCRLDVPSFPARVPDFAIAMRIRFSSDEEGEHRLRVFISDLDGRIVGPAEERTFEACTPPNETFSWLSAVLFLRDIRIQCPNDYRVNVEIDGESIADTTIYVSEHRP